MVIARGHTQIIFVGEVTLYRRISLFSAYYLSTYCYKHMRLLIQYSIIAALMAI